MLTFELLTTQELLLYFSLVLIVPAITAAPALIIRYGGGKKRREWLNEYIRNLNRKGFKISKQIILQDFATKYNNAMAGRVFATKLGIWVDYQAKQLVVRSWLDEVIPTIYSFDDLQDYELLEGTKSVFRGAAIGYGPIGGVLGRHKEIAASLSIRIVMGNASRGANSITIQFFKKMRMNTKNSMNQACLQCAYAIIDELGNIMRQQIAEQNSGGDVVVQQVSDADELAKFKKLLDDGIITQEEFDAKKKQILGL